MADLKRTASGHLRRNPTTGNLVLGCDGCCTCGECPGGREGCPSSFALAVSGIGGPGPSCCLPGIDGSYTLTGLPPGAAQWATSATAVNPANPACAGGWALSCQSVDCYNNPGPPRWVISLFGSVNFVWAERPCVPATPNCPPTGAYVVTCNSCAGGTSASIVLS
jgi:hypothetical protein